MKGHLKNIQQFCAYLCLSVLLLIPVSVNAAFAITVKEMGLLPEYCKGLSLSNYEPAAQKFIILGASDVGLSDVHHFCHGLKFIIRADLDPTQARLNLNDANNQFSYVIRHLPQAGTNTKYAAIVRAKRAKVLERLGKISESIQDYKAAINYNEKLSTAYAGLSDLYLKINNIDEARKILEQGLNKNPNSRSLKRRVKRLPK